MAKKKAGWTNVRVPKGLMEEVDRFIEQSKGSFTSRSDFVKAAIREKLDKRDDIHLVRDLISAIQKNPELKKTIRKKTKS